VNLLVLYSLNRAMNGDADGKLPTLSVYLSASL
jgi:hypothetical protein